MHPVFFPSFTIDHEPVLPSYFVMLAFGFTLATLLGMRWAKRSALDASVVFDLGLHAVLAGLIGGRILHVLADGLFWDYVHLCTDPSKVQWKIDEHLCRSYDGAWDTVAAVCRPKGRDCLAWLAFWNGGLAYYGGLILATFVCVRFLKRERFPVWKGADMAGMTIPLGLFFGRLGCFLGGCCFGSLHDGTFAVSFPPWSAASEAHAKQNLLPAAAYASRFVHPAQLYEAFGSLAIAALMMLVVHPRKRFDGQVLLSFLIGYAALRFGLEFLRADDRGAILGLSTSQWISVLIVGACGYAWNLLQQRATTV